MRAFKEFKKLAGDTSLLAVSLGLLAGSAVILPACGFKWSKVVTVDTPTPLVERGYPEVMTLYQTREARQLWKAEMSVVDLEWAMREADAEGLVAVLEAFTMQAVTTAEGAVSATGGGPLTALALGALGAGGGYLQGSKRTRKKIERGEA